MPFDSTEVATRLLAWYGRCGRDLPWRHSRDPYRIWLSEIMLQQTTVAAVIPYFQRFLQHFPDVATLAAAPVEAVIAQWAGLGYYSRARNLHAAAQRVMGEHGGVFPPDLEALQLLPGVGRSTAGAIYCIAFDRPGAILDGNVRRVLCRLFALEGDPRSASAEKQLWRWAEALTPAQNCHDYAQASMDLGATVCIPSAPACPACPLETLCQARRLGLEGELPRARPKKTIPTQTQVALLLGLRGKFLVRRRPLSGMLGGLWEFPGREVGAGETAAAAARDLLRELGLEGELLPAGGVRHAYSHFKLDLQLFSATVADAATCAEGDQTAWLTPAELGTLALHGAHQKALSLLPAACSEPGGANLFQE